MEKILNNIIADIETKIKLPKGMNYTYSNIQKIIEKSRVNEIIIFFGINFKSLISLILSIYTKGYLEKSCVISSFIPENILLYYILSILTSIPVVKMFTGKLNSKEFSDLLKICDRLLSKNPSIIFNSESSIFNKNFSFENFSKSYNNYQNILFFEKKINDGLKQDEIISLIKDTILKFISVKKPEQKIFFNIICNKNILPELVRFPELHNKKISIVLNLNKTFLGFIKKYISNFSENILIEEINSSEKISNSYLYTNFASINKILNFE